MTDLEIAKTLRDAARYVRDHGWTIGSGRDGEGRVCALGALTAVSPGMEFRPQFGGDGERQSPDYARLDACAVTQALAAALREVVNARRVVLGLPLEEGACSFVYTFNDTVAKSTEAVTDAFESLALQHELRALAAESPRMRGEVPEAVHA